VLSNRARWPLEEGKEALKKTRGTWIAVGGGPSGGEEGGVWGGGLQTGGRSLPADLRGVLRGERALAANIWRVLAPSKQKREEVRRAVQGGVCRLDRKREQGSGNVQKGPRKARAGQCGRPM